MYSSCSYLEEVVLAKLVGVAGVQDDHAHLLGRLDCLLVDQGLEDDASYGVVHPLAVRLWIQRAVILGVDVEVTRQILRAK